VSSSGASGIKRSVSALPGREAIVRTAADREVIAATASGGEREAVRLADGPVLRAAMDRLTDHLVEVLAEIATARERAERGLPPDRWVGGSHCRGNV
jgi:hypothetical protein